MLVLQFDDPMHDQPYHREDREEEQEAHDTVRDISLLHVPCSQYSLTDLDRKGDHNDDGEHIKERNEHRVSGTRQPQEQRVQRADQRQPEEADHQKMKFLICEARLNRVVPRQNEIVYAGNQPGNCV